jgi:hypothetical protein
MTARRQETSVTLESVSKWLNKLSDEIIYLGSQIHGPLGDASLPFGKSIASTVTLLTLDLTCAIDVVYNLSPNYLNLSRHLSLSVSSSLSLSSSLCLFLSLSLSLPLSLSPILASLIEELEEIASSVSTSSSSSALASSESSSYSIQGSGADMNSFPRGWAVDCALKMGVRHCTVIECQMGILDRWNTKIPEKHTHLLSSISYALLEWRRHASW